MLQQISSTGEALVAAVEVRCYQQEGGSKKVWENLRSYYNAET